MALPTAPVLFIKPRTALASPYPSALNIPRCAQDETADYEAELCVVMGRTGRDIAEEDAMDFVLGYTASNDVSARRLQFETSQWSFAKGLDNSCPIGPVLISPRGLPDPHNVSVKAIYNNEVVQQGSTKDLIFTVPQLIAHLSKGTTLEAGSLILTGTPAGIGFFKKPRIYLEHEGDIRVEIGGGIGTLINKVRYEDF